MSSPSPSNENLSAYFDQEASAEERLEMESLLEESAAARRELHEFGEISRLLQETATESAPPELAASIRKRIEQETLLKPGGTTPVKPGPSLLRYRIAVAISACSSLAALVLFILLLNIPENRGASSWQLSSMERQGEAELVVSADTLLQNQPQPAASPQAKFSYQDDSKTTMNDHVVSAQPKMPLRSARPIASQPSDKRTRSASEPQARKAASSFSVSNSAVEKKFMKSARGASGRAGLSLPAAPELSGLPGHIPLDSVRIGDVLPYFSDIDGKVAVIEVRVVDVKQALGTMEVLLARNNIPVSPEKQSEVERQLRRSNRSSDQSAQGNKTKQQAATNQQQLFAVFVEASDAQVASALNDLQKDLNQNQLLGLSLQPAINESSLTEGVENLPRLLAKNTNDAHAAVELRDSSVASLKEMETVPDSRKKDGVVDRNYSLKQKAAVADADKKKDTPPHERPAYQTLYRMQVPPEQLKLRSSTRTRPSTLADSSNGKLLSGDAPLTAEKPVSGAPFGIAASKAEAKPGFRTSGIPVSGIKPPVKVLFVFKPSQNVQPSPTPPASR